MRGVRIEDGTRNDPTASLPPGTAGCLDFDLAEVLEALGTRAAQSYWRAEHLDCFGDGYAEFVALCEAGALIPGAQLRRLADTIVQVIDGDFTGTEPEAEGPWIIVKAVDSSWWEVWTDDAGAFASLRQRFRAVADIREPAA